MRGFRGKLASASFTLAIAVGAYADPPGEMNMRGATVTARGPSAASSLPPNAAPRQVTEDFLRRTEWVASRYNQYDRDLMQAYGRSGVTMSLIGGQALTEALAALPALPDDNIQRTAREDNRQRVREAAQTCLLQNPQQEINRALLSSISQIEGSGESSRLTQLREDLHRQEIFYLRLQAYIGNGPEQLIQLLRGLSYGLNLTQQERAVLGITELRTNSAFTEAEAQGAATETAFTLREAQPEMGAAFDAAASHRRFRDTTANELLGPRWRTELDAYNSGLREAQNDALNWLQRERALLGRIEGRLRDLRRQYQEELARARNLSPEALRTYQSRVNELRDSLKECIDRTSLALLMAQVAPTIPSPNSPAGPEDPAVATNLVPAQRDYTVAGDGRATGSTGSAGSAASR